MAKKHAEYIASPRGDTTSTTNTECDNIKEQPSKEEGGFEAWLTLLGSLLVYYSSYGLLNSFGFFQNYYQNDFLKSTSPSTISFIGTLQIALTSSIATISGAICDAHGIRVSYLHISCKYLIQVC
jgi:MCP family monocarboxylic acid transporter-like MFS transporter 10